MIHLCFPHERMLQVQAVITGSATRCHTYLLSELRVGVNINRRWMSSVKTLSLSITCVTKHLKSLQLSCEVMTAQLK